MLLDEHGNLKISDFGLSSLYVGDADGEGTSRTELLHTTCGTPNYVAPEVLSDQGYDGKKADVWSCGVILYVLLAGFLPFDESTIVALFAKIQNADFTYPSWFTPEVRSLLDQMLVADPHARIVLANLKNHPWFVGPDGGGADGSTSAEPTAAPTVDQMESAFQPLHHTKSDSAEEGSAVTEDFDDNDFPKSADGPVQLNAFDLVSQCGGFHIDKMFSPEIFYTAAAEDSSSSTAAASKSYAHLGGSILFGSNASKGKSYHFTASNISAADLSKAVYEALEAIGFSFDDSKDMSIHHGIVRGTFLSAKGMVGLFAQVFVLTPTLCLLEIKKGKGDILEWTTAYTELIERRIAHLLNKPAAGDAKAVF